MGRYLRTTSNYLKNDHARKGEVSRIISNMYESIGYNELSQTYLNQAARIFSKRRYSNSLLNAYYLNLRNLINSKYYTKAVAHADSIFDFPVKSSAQNHYSQISKYYRAQAYYSLGKYSRCIEDISAYLGYREKLVGGNYWKLSDAYFLLFSSLYKYKNKEDAFNLFEEVSEKYDWHAGYLNPDQLHFYNRVSELLLKDDKYQFVINNLNPIIDKNSEAMKRSKTQVLFQMKLSDSYYLGAKAFFQKYLISKDVNDLGKSWAMAEQGLLLGQESNKHFKPQKDKISDRTAIRSKIDLLVILIFEQKDSLNQTNERLYRFIETSKSAHLLELLNNNLAVKNSNIPDSLTLQVNSLKQQSSYLSTQINRLEGLTKLSESDSSKLSDFKSVLLDNKIAFNDLMLYLEKTFPRYYEVNYNPKIVTITDVQQNLREDEALIEYFVGTDNIYAFTISKDTAVVSKFAELSKGTIDQFRDVLQPKRLGGDVNETYREFVRQSYELYEHLLAEPIALLENNEQPIKKLFIIPDKSLNYISFDLLLTEEMKKISYKGYGKLPYLINDYNISYGYSASILFREDSITTTRPFNGKLLAFAPSYEELLSDSSQLSQLGEFRNSLSNLKYNKSEVDGIGQYFNATTYKAARATERTFFQQVAGNDIIHLAMHGLVDKSDSEKSRLVFTPSKDSIHDDYLHNFELYNMNLDAKLAVLSACNTGYGKLEGGEGVMSIARAFTYAGVESMVMSQWPADDESSSIIMQYFYKYLSAGMRKDEALRLAKLDYLAEAKPLKQNPFYWNNFVVMGDVSPIVTSNRNIYGYLVIALVVLLIAAICLVYYLKRRKLQRI